MSDIPDTDNIAIAAMAAAGEIAKRPADGSNRDYFADRLERFLTAYRAIMIAYGVSTADPAQINAEKIIAGQK